MFGSRQSFACHYFGYCSGFASNLRETNSWHVLDWLATLAQRWYSYHAILKKSEESEGVCIEKVWLKIQRVRKYLCVGINLLRVHLLEVMTNRMIELMRTPLTTML